MDIKDCKLCPECDGDALATVDTVDAKTRSPKGQKIACFECGALGPLSEDLNAAVIAWNSMEKPSEFMCHEPEL